MKKDEKKKTLPGKPVKPGELPFLDKGLAILNRPSKRQK